MNVNKYLKNRIRGWLPKELGLAYAGKSSKPCWWKPLWIATLLLTIASGFVSYFLLNVPLERAVSAVALTFFCIGIAYYIRVRPSMKVNRAIYILLGITPIGFCIWIVVGLIGLSRLLLNAVGPLPSLIISWIVCLGVGALIGDWIGKRRTYQLPLSP